MCGGQLPLERGEFADERACIAAAGIAMLERCDPAMEVSHHGGKQTLYIAHELKGYVREPLAYLDGERVRDIAEERGEVDVLVNEGDARDLAIKPSTRLGEELRSTCRFDTRDGQEAGGESERDEEEDEVTHTY